VEAKEKIIVGVNEFAMEEKPVPILYIDETVARDQTAQVEALRASRDNGRVARALDALRGAAAGTDNLMPPILEATRAYATLGEMCDALRQVWGEYEEAATF
jgi:methylmalonyl-CoA mutase N-terminal domain/subunit